MGLTYPLRLNQQMCQHPFCSYWNNNNVSSEYFYRSRNRWGPLLQSWGWRDQRIDPKSWTKENIQATIQVVKGNIPHCRRFKLILVDMTGKGEWTCVKGYDNADTTRWTQRVSYKCRCCYQLAYISYCPISYFLSAFQVNYTEFCLVKFNLNRLLQSYRLYLSCLLK